MDKDEVEDEDEGFDALFLLCAQCFYFYAFTSGELITMIMRVEVEGLLPALASMSAWQPISSKLHAKHTTTRNLNLHRTYHLS